MIPGRRCIRSVASYHGIDSSQPCGIIYRSRRSIRVKKSLFIYSGGVAKVSTPLRKGDSIYTYADYRSWPDGERWELLNGVAWNMSLAPGRRHQAILMELSRRIANFLLDHPCEVYPAPFDVLIPDTKNQSADEVRTVVQPDISVVCDRSILTDAGCLGAPQLVIEIVSPYTSQKDMHDKFLIYQTAEVREYWIVDPGNFFVQVFQLINGKFGEGGVYEDDMEISSAVIAGFTITPEELFVAYEP